MGCNLLLANDASPALGHGVEPQNGRPDVHGRAQAHEDTVSPGEPYQGIVPFHIYHISRHGRRSVAGDQRRVPGRRFLRRDECEERSARCRCEDVNGGNVSRCIAGTRAEGPFAGRRSRSRRDRARPMGGGWPPPPRAYGAGHLSGGHGRRASDATSTRKVSGTRALTGSAAAPPRVPTRWRVAAVNDAYGTSRREGLEMTSTKKLLLSLNSAVFVGRSRMAMREGPHPRYRRSSLSHRATVWTALRPPPPATTQPSLHHALAPPLDMVGAIPGNESS